MTRVKAADSHDFAALLEELDTLLPKEAHSTDREAAQKWLLALWITRDADQTGFLWLFDSALQSGPGDRQTRGGGVERTRAARAAFRSCATENAIV